MDELGVLIKKHKVVIFTKSNNEDTEYVEEIFTSLEVPVKLVLLDTLAEKGRQLEQELFRRIKKEILPIVFVNGWECTGRRNVRRFLESGILQQMLDGNYVGYDYDLLVIGGGSGGIAAAREAARLGALVCLCDFVTPSPYGTSWGLGGTCTNVGCVPKKLMHMAAMIGTDLDHASVYGWGGDLKKLHDWPTMITEIQNHVKALNFGYRKALREASITYMNARVRFMDANTVATLDRRGGTTMIKAREFLLATGGRPIYMDIPGANYAITSDDIFSLSEHPGKVLVVGASYVAVECAGFLNSMGVDTTLCVRKNVLRKFDQQMAELIVKYMTNQGVKFVRDAVVDAIAQVEPGSLEVTVRTRAGEVYTEQYNTVLFAIGRKPCTQGMGLENAGVALNPITGFVIVNERDQTSVSHIHAVGDMCEGRAQLTPVAIQSGKLLARRLFGNEDTITDHTLIPSAVFAPLEYGFVGLTEEEAIGKYGSIDVRVSHANYVPPGDCLAVSSEVCYAKIISISSKHDRVVGFHVCGPDAGEITQGFALALKMGARRQDFLNQYPVHPSSASIFSSLFLSKQTAPDTKSPRGKT